MLFYPEKMKASLKLRENQDPLLKSKIPLNIVGFPFRSSLEASGNSKELCLSFSSAFESGPLFKLNYRPNDPCRPFGLVLRTGTGPFGSSVGSPISISAEFNLLGNKNPSFFLYFKPRAGDFVHKHTIVSDISFPSQSPLAATHNSDSKTEGRIANSDEEQQGTSWTTMLSGGLEAAKRLISSGEMTARTRVPVREVAVVKLRWGVRSPAVEGEEKQDEWLRKLPYLVLNKIGIEHVERRNEAGRECNSRERDKVDDVVEACLGIKKELEVLRNDNEILKKEFDKFKTEIGGWPLLHKRGGKIQTQDPIL